MKKSESIINMMATFMYLQTYFNDCTIEMWTGRTRGEVAVTLNNNHYNAPGVITKLGEVTHAETTLQRTDYDSTNETELVIQWRW